MKELMRIFSGRKLDLEEVAAAMERQETLDIPVTHLFSEGLYTRTIVIPAGTLVLGKRHRKETLNILLRGMLTLFFEDGGEPETIEAPAVFVSRPGVKKLAYCHDEAEFLNVHPTNEKDLDKIESDFIMGKEEGVCLGSLLP